MSDEAILQLPSEIVKVETMANNSLRLKLDTQENLSAEQAMKIMEMRGKLGWFTFTPHGRIIQPEDLISLPRATKYEEEDKSPSQRLRAVLFVLWEQRGSPKTFDEFYRQRMEQIINSAKELLT